MSCSVCKSAPVGPSIDEAMATVLEEIDSVRDDLRKHKQKVKQQLDDLSKLVAVARTNGHGHHDSHHRDRHDFDYGGAAVNHEELAKTLRTEMQAQKHEVSGLVEKKIAQEVEHLRKELSGPKDTSWWRNEPKGSQGNRHQTEAERRQAEAERHRAEAKHEIEDHKEKAEMWREMQGIRDEFRRELAELAAVRAGGGSAHLTPRASPRELALQSFDEAQDGGYGPFATMRHRSGELNAEFEALSEREQDQLLLIMLSHVHTTLVLSPYRVLTEIFHEQDVRPPWPFAVARTLIVTIAIAAVMSGVPLVFGQYIEPLGCEANRLAAQFGEETNFDVCVLDVMVQGPFGWALGPAAFAFLLACVGVAVAAFFAADLCLAMWCCSCCRLTLAGVRFMCQGLLLKLYFSWLRARLPIAVFAGPVTFAAVCLSYVFLVAGLAALAVMRGGLPLGLPVALVVGEVYCGLLNLLLAPSDFVDSVAQAELRRCQPVSLWPRLRETSGTSFALSTAEAKAFRQRVWPWWCTQDPTWAPCIPRHIRKVYLTDQRRSFEWDGLEYGLDVSSAQHLLFGSRKGGYSSVRWTDVGDLEGGPLGSHVSRASRATDLGEPLGIFGAPLDDLDGRGKRELLRAAEESMRTITPRTDVMLSYDGPLPLERHRHHHSDAGHDHRRGDSRERHDRDHRRHEGKAELALEVPHAARRGGRREHDRDRDRRYDDDRDRY